VDVVTVAEKNASVTVPPELILSYTLY